MDLKFVPEKQVLAELGLSRMTLHRWRKNGLPYYKVGKIIMYNQQEITRFIGAHQSTYYIEQKRKSQIDDVSR